MSQARQRAIAYVLRDEGSEYTDQAQDTGGPTRWGITQRAWSDYVGHEATPQEIEALGLQQAEAFYGALWHQLRLALLPHEGLAIALFDAAVLCGGRPVVRLLQRLLQVPADGVLGPKTAEAVARYDVAPLLDLWVDALALHFAAVVEAEPTKVIFLRGWLRRAFRLRALAASPMPT